MQPGINSERNELLVMKDVQSFARISSVIPTISLTSFLISLLIGILSFGHIPVYGADPDPYSINSNILDFLKVINLFSGLIGFMAVPAWLFLTAHLLINRIKFTQKDLFFHLSAIFSLLFILLFKFVWTSQFYWFFD